MNAAARSPSTGRMSSSFQPFNAGPCWLARFCAKFAAGRTRSDAERSVVFDETKWRPVRHVGAEVGVEAARRRTTGDGFRENVRHAASCCPVATTAPPSGFASSSLPGFLGGLEQRALLLRDGPIPAEMPFADGRRAIAMLLRQRAEGHAIRRDRGSPKTPTIPFCKRVRQ